MAGTSEGQQAWTKRTMLLTLDVVRKKLQRMPDWNEYTRNGLPGHGEYAKFFGMDRKSWAGKLKKILPKLVKFQTELERRKAEGETLDDSKRSSFQGRDDIIFRMEGFGRLFGFLPEGYEWEEFYPYFDIPDEKTRKRFFFGTAALQDLIDANYPRIAKIRQGAGLKPLTYADFGVGEQQPTEDQLNDVSIEITRVLEGKAERENSKPEFATEVAQPEPEKVGEAKPDSATELVVEAVIESTPIAEVPEIFSQEVFEDLVAITKNADYKSNIGIWRWVREVSVKLNHLITPDEITNIPGALSFEDLERKLGPRPTWKRIVAGTGLKDPLLDELEELEPEPKPELKTVVDALDECEVEMTGITPMESVVADAEVGETSVEAEDVVELGNIVSSDATDETEMVEATEEEAPAEVVDVTEENSGKVEEDLNQTEKSLIRPKVFASEDEAAEWFRSTCIECGYLINSGDFRKHPDWPSFQTLKRYLGPMQDWKKYVADLKLGERPALEKACPCILSFDGYVKALRDATKENNGLVPGLRELSAIYPDGPSYKALIEHLGAHSSWSEYLGHEYDYVDTFDMVDYDSVLDELMKITEQADFETTEGATNWLRSIYATLQRFPTDQEIKALLKGKMSCTALQIKVGLERKDWGRCLISSAEYVKDLGLPESQKDKVEPSTMIEVNNMDDERKVETVEEETEAVEVMEAAASAEEMAEAEDLRNPGGVDDGAIKVTKNLNVRREAIFESEGEALASLSKLRKKLGRTIKNSDFPAGEEFASIQTYMTMLSSRKNWDTLLDYYEAHGFDDTLREMIELGLIRQALQRDDVTRDDLLKELAKIYLSHGNKIPSYAVFKKDNIWPSHEAFKRCFGEVWGWKALVLDYLERHPMMTTEATVKDSAIGISQEEFANTVYPEVMKAESASLGGEAVVHDVDDVESVDEESSKPEVEVETSDDSAAKDEAVQTISVPKVHVKVPKDGKGTINLTLTLNLQISFDE